MTNYTKFTEMWVSKFGPLPRNYEITFFDGNHENCCLSNLGVNGVGLLDDNYKSILKRHAHHFSEEGLYVKEDQCYKLIEYIEELEQFRDLAFKVYPNIDLDIESVR